jgi:hypothetical protein
MLSRILGNQAEHLLSHLREAWARIHGLGAYPNYHLVYQPVMLMKERSVAVSCVCVVYKTSL